MAVHDIEPDAPTDERYEQVLAHAKRLSYLGDGAGYLGWDQQVTMPDAGTPARAKQLATLSTIRHELAVDEEYGAALEALQDTEGLDADQQAILRELSRAYERAAAVPGALVEEITQVSTENQEVWQEAKAESDFAAFAPRLERMRDLQRERAGHIAPDRDPYVVTYEDSHPYIDFETMTEIFETLRAELIPLIEAVRESPVTPAQPFDRAPYPAADQEALSEAVLDRLGYDWDRGRLDTSAHPFTMGTQFDARVTTRFQEADPLDALTATIHEFGHATYQLGLRQDAYGTPLGAARGSIHESQSRFWENHIGRTKPFIESIRPLLEEHLGHDDLTTQAVWETANRVRPANPIRVEADELTYHMHIILRSEIGRAALREELAIEDIPAVWNEKMDEYLGVRPDTDAEGCLQDIHWTRGFAAFESYTLGSVVAAQLDRAIRADLDVDALVRAGNYEPIHEWMTEHVHRHGQRHPTPELIEQATGEPLSAEPFVEYVREKFTTLYDL